MARTEIASVTDTNTGRLVRQLTQMPGGAVLDYFRIRKHLPDGRMLAHAKHDRGDLILIDPISGSVEPLPISTAGATAQLQAGSRHLWLYRRAEREVWTTELPHGKPQLAMKLPDDLPGAFEDISCDGTTIIISHHLRDPAEHPIPTVNDLAALRRYFERPRAGEIWTYHLPTRTASRILAIEGSDSDHIDTSPIDPGLIRYCLDGFESTSQRIWCVRTDGSEKRMIRPQQYGEMITHEFWWADGRHIGYTYMDRRNDPTLWEVPLNEYAQVPTRLGIANLEGQEIYSSNPLNCYHSHIYLSSDGRYISGEGTHDHSYVYVAPFTWDDPRIDLQPMATIHTPYVPTRGQQVECNFSADSRWLLYNDTAAGGKLQVFAVQVEL